MCSPIVNREICQHGNYLRSCGIISPKRNSERISGRVLYLIRSGCISLRVKRYKVVGW